MMHDAVHSFLEDRDIGAFNIQAIALEGQGEVEHRVDKLYEQLVARKEWLQAIKMADAVFFATHSQGAIVTTQLIARLLDQELIRGPQTHLYIYFVPYLCLSALLTLIDRLAMCGIAQGPCELQCMPADVVRADMTPHSHLPLPVDGARAVLHLRRVDRRARAL